MVKQINIYSGSIGLNSVLDPQRISHGSRDRPGIIEFAEAVNVSIDERGLVTVRDGDELSQPGSFHSLFCDGGYYALAVEERENDAAIVIIGGDGKTLAVVSAGLDKFRRMSFSTDGNDIFYSNGRQNGFIRNGIANSWPVGSYSGPDVDIEFTQAPVADLIAFRPGGQVILSEGSSLWINHEPWQYGLFSKRIGYLGFDSAVLMLCSVQGGFFVSDCNRIWFFRQTGSWYEYKQELCYNYPALAWSLSHDKIMLRDIDIDLPGFCRVFATKNGICLCSDEGFVMNLTENKVKYPKAYNYGACLICYSKIINTVF